MESGVLTTWYNDYKWPLRKEVDTRNPILTSGTHLFGTNENTKRNFVECRNRKNKQTNAKITKNNESVEKGMREEQ
jgi:hypothetical protein